MWIAAIRSDGPKSAGGPQGKLKQCPAIGTESGTVKKMRSQKLVTAATLAALFVSGCATHKPEPGRGAAARACKIEAEETYVADSNMYVQAGARAVMQDRCMRRKGFSTAWF